MFELNGSYSDVQKTKTKTANRSRFWLPKVGTLDETIEERCLICPYSARRKRKQALYYKGDYIENLVLCATMCREVFSGEYFKLQLKAS